MAVWPLAVQLLKNYTAPYSDQVPYYLSPFSNKSFLIQTPLLSTNLGFFFPALVQFRRFFHWQYLWSFGFPLRLPHQLEDFSSIDPLSDFPLQSLIIGLGDFSPATWSFETHQLPHGARIFSLVSRFSSSVLTGLGNFLFKIPPQQTTTRSIEFASKKKGNCNVMVTRPINHMTLARDQSHDLLIWSQHMTYESSHYWFQHPRHHSSWYQVIIDFNIRVTIHVMTTSWSPSIPTARVFNKSKDLVWASSRVLEGLQGRLLSGQCPIQIPVVVAWEKYSQSLLMKATDGSHSEWWAEWLAGCSISLILEDVNVSFNYLPYYSMSRGDGRVVS